MKVFALVLCFFWSFSIFGQLKSNTDTIVVDALSLPLKLNETGRSITILTQQDFQNISANSLDELLQTVTGIEVQSRGGFGVQADIIMRGSTFTQVLILIDGMKMNDPLTGHFNGNIPVNISDIEKIEILRGAGSSIYGPDAVGGVINIKTKTFSNKKNNTSIDGEIGFGQFNLVDAHAGIYNQNKNLKYGGSISVQQAEGPEYKEILIDTNTTLSSYNSHFDIKTISAAIGYSMNNEWSIHARTSFDHRDFDARYFYTTSTFDKSSEIVSNWFNHFQINRISGRHASDINIAFKYATDEFVFSPDLPSTNNHVTNFTNFTFNHLYEINSSLQLKTGIQLDQRSIESNDRGNHKDLHYGWFGLLAHHWNNLHTNVNARIDYDENYNLEILPGFNISYVLPAFVIRGSTGRTIRAADYTERYVSNNLTNLTPGRSLGNPGLIAESSWSTELGFDTYFQENMSLHSTLFHRQSGNLIDYVLTNQSEIGSVSEIGTLQIDEEYFFAKNISEVTTLGFETEVNYRLNINENFLINGSIGYTFQQTENEEDIVSVYIANAAKHLFTNNLNFKFNRMNLSVNTLLKSRDERKAESINSTLNNQFILWNSKLNYDLTSDTFIGIELRNIFDIKYQNILGANMPPRWFKFHFGWSLK